MTVNASVFYNDIINVLTYFLDDKTIDIQKHADKMQKIFEKATKHRQIYNQKMIDQYTKTHNIFEYVYFYLLHFNISF